MTAIENHKARHNVWKLLNYQNVHSVNTNDPNEDKTNAAHCETCIPKGFRHRQDPSSNVTLQKMNGCVHIPDIKL
jgi:flavoprotein